MFKQCTVLWKSEQFSIHGAHPELAQAPMQCVYDHMRIISGSLLRPRAAAFVRTQRPSHRPLLPSHPRHLATAQAVMKLDGPTDVTSIIDKLNESYEKVEPE